MSDLSVHVAGTDSALHQSSQNTLRIIALGALMGLTVSIGIAVTMLCALAAGS
jgi:hypothetical protein